MHWDDEIAFGPDPPKLAPILSELFAKRGYGRVQGDRQLADAWKTLAGEDVATATRVGRLRRGTLQVDVGNSALLAELNSFYRDALQQQFQQQFPRLGVRILKFNLDSTIRPAPAEPDRTG